MEGWDAFAQQFAGYNIIEDASLNEQQPPIAYMSSIDGGNRWAVRPMP